MESYFILIQKLGLIDYSLTPSDIFQAEYHNQKVAVKIYSAERYQDVQAFLIEAAIMTYVKRDIVAV